MSVHTKEIVDLQTWWMGELKLLTQKVMSEEERRQKKAKDKALKSMGEYRTYADIQDAYGCGVISEKKHDQLLDLLEKTSPDPDKLYGMKIELLSEFYNLAKQIVEDNSRE